MDRQPTSTDAEAPTGRGRGPLRFVVAVLMALALVFAITVFTGVPGLRPSLSSLNALADKINGCAPGAASVDWVIGQVDTNGEPIGPGKELTPDERTMLGANGKVGYICEAIE